MFIVAYLLIALYSFVVVFRNIFLGGMPFWYDPARDLTLAGDMFNKFSLLGQPSGIPGFFYPPYWLWLLFSFLHLSRDPAIITFFAITLPYLIFFPLGLWLLRDKLSKAGILLILAVFVVQFDNYFTQLWNLNLAPLILLWVLVAFHRKKYLFLGVLTGILLCFDFALGVPVAICALLFSKLDPRFLSGNVLIFVPTIIFELRNKFVMAKALFPSILSKVVSSSGLTKLDIIRAFIPGLGIAAVSILRRRVSREGWFVISLLLTIAFIYLRNANPIWTYHFIGLETINLILFCFLVNGLLVKFENPAVAAVALLLVIRLFLLIRSPDNIYNFDNLTTKKQVTEFILRDNVSNKCGFTAYGATAFERNYEYEYLLNYLSAKYRLVAPAINSNDYNCVYVVFPLVSQNQLESYLNSVTEVGKFGTEWKREFPSGLTVVLRQRHERR